MNFKCKSMLRKLAFVGAGLLFLGVGFGVLGWLYVRANPLIFNESFLGHQHCMKQTTMLLLMYAQDHNGKFPLHTNGYADALISMSNDWPHLLTGPGYDITPVMTAWKAGRDIPESELGRVYIQGLDKDDDAEIAIVFDKLPTPGGDHCNGLSRIWAPLVREVGFVSGGTDCILERNWAKFSQKQIDLLVAAGISKEKAEASYAEKPKRELAKLAKKYSNR